MYVDSYVHLKLYLMTDFIYYFSRQTRVMNMPGPLRKPQSKKFLDSSR